MATSRIWFLSILIILWINQLIKCSVSCPPHSTYCTAYGPTTANCHQLESCPTYKTWNNSAVNMVQGTLHVKCLFYVWRDMWVITWSGSAVHTDGKAHIWRQPMLTARSFAAWITCGGRKQINLSKSFLSHKTSNYKVHCASVTEDRHRLWVSNQWFMAWNVLHCGNVMQRNVAWDRRCNKGEINNERTSVSLRWRRQRGWKTKVREDKIIE